MKIKKMEKDNDKGYERRKSQENGERRKIGKEAKLFCLNSFKNIFE